MASSEAPVIDPLAKEDDSPLRLSVLRDEYKNELLEILDGMRGKKCLVMDAQLSSLLNMVVLEGSKLLKDSGVNFFRELKGEYLGDFTIDSGRAVPENIVYLVRPNLNLMKIIAKQILNSVKTGIRSQYHIYFVPHRTLVCEQMLEDEGISLDHDGVRIGEFHMGMIPFDTDILSLEMADVFKQCYVDGDTSPLNAAARSLLQLQNLYGLIPQVRSKGAAARKVLQKLLHLRREEESLKQDKQISYNSMKLIDTLVVMDREVDLISPLITPLTYEGLIDEVVGIENSKIKLDSSIINDGKDEQLPIKMPNVPGVDLPTPNESIKRDVQPGDMVTVTLNSSDLIYTEIRDLSIEQMGPFLQERAIKIRKSYANFRDNKDASISEIHDFVKKIPALTNEYKSLNAHINIAELIKQTTDKREFRENWQCERGILEGEVVIDQIEDLICADTDRSLYYKVLRMLCLQSVTAGGIRSNKYDNIKKLIIQTYGYEQMFTLTNLERTGLLRRKDMILVETTPLWQGLRSKLRLIDERNLSRADDISYVSAGYAPLSVRLIQLLGNNSWSQISDVMRSLPGPMLEFNQIEATEELAEAIMRCGSDSSSSSSSSSSNIFNTSSSVEASSNNTGNKKVMLLFVVGGLTFLEIAALRLLSRDPAFPFTIVMATTKLINGKSLLKTMVNDFKTP